MNSQCFCLTIYYRDVDSSSTDEESIRNQETRGDCSSAARGTSKNGKGSRRSMCVPSCDLFSPRFRRGTNDISFFFTIYNTGPYNRKECSAIPSARSPMHVLSRILFLSLSLSIYLFLSLYRYSFSRCDCTRR